MTVHDFGGVYAHPLFKHGGVDAAEVNRVLQVLALRPCFGTEGRVLGVEAAVNRLADNKRAASGAVVGAAAVVLDSATELGENEHHHVVSGVVLVEVVEEVADRAGEVLKQLRMRRVLVGVCVVAAVAGIEDTCAKSGGMHPCDVSQALGYRVVAVFDAGAVLRGGSLQPVGAAKDVHAGAGEVFHHWACAYRLRVHVLENLECLIALIVLADAG